MPNFVPPDNFLGLPQELSAPESSAVWVLPIPYEATVSYEGGTNQGPRAILEASTQVELYDLELDYEPVLEFGVHTLPALETNNASPAAMVHDIAAAVVELSAPGRLLVGLGGEHTVSVGFGRGLAQVHGPLVVVQLDAHGDLRNSYQGAPYSHACAARRLLDPEPRVTPAQGLQLVQIGIRSLSREEIELIRAHPGRIRTFFASEVHQRPAYLSELADLLRGRNIFLTIDLDALDPAYMPATGTPEPGGLSWQQALDALQAIITAGHVVGFDCVEFSPQAGAHGAAFLAARLVYKTMSLIMQRHTEGK